MLFVDDVSNNWSTRLHQWINYHMYGMSVMDDYGFKLQLIYIYTHMYMYIYICTHINIHIPCTILLD